MSTVSANIALRTIEGDGVYGGRSEEAPDNPRYRAVLWYWNDNFQVHNYKLCENGDMLANMFRLYPRSELLWESQLGLTEAGKEFLSDPKHFEAMRPYGVFTQPQ